MMSKEEYLNLVDVLADEDKFDEYVWNFVWHGDDISGANVEQAKNYAVENLKKLIVEHFNNTEDFKHFKLYSDSTLKNMNKDELIDYIHTLHRNYKATDISCNSAMNYAISLQNEIERLKDNPPLKFEELKENMWVWDSKYNEWCYICFISGKYPHRKYIDNCISDGIFEENRFYRREVK